MAIKLFTVARNKLLGCPPACSLRGRLYYTLATAGETLLGKIGAPGWGASWFDGWRGHINIPHDGNPCLVHRDPAKPLGWLTCPWA